MGMHIAVVAKGNVVDFLDKPQLNFLEMQKCEIEAAAQEQQAQDPKRNRLALSTNFSITTTLANKLRPEKTCIAPGAHSIAWIYMHYSSISNCPIQGFSSPTW